MASQPTKVTSSFMHLYGSLPLPCFAASRLSLCFLDSVLHP